MYIPEHYREEDKSKLIGFIRENSFALLVNSGDSGLRGTHLPFVTEERESGIVLVSHMAKANPQWKEFGQGKEVLVVFTGPHGYVSPSNYEKQQNVPTWNYVAIHAYGVPEIVSDARAVVEVLEKMIVNYEAAFREQWDQLNEDYKAKMIKGIVAFEIPVKKLEGKYKLSQNKTKNEQENVIHSFEKEKNPVAELMKQNLPK